MKSIGIALCRHDTSTRGYLFQMPRYANLNAGDRVIVETKNGEKDAVILETLNTYTSDNDYRMALLASGAQEPLKKVLRKVEERELTYSDDDLSVWEEHDE